MAMIKLTQSAFAVCVIAAVCTSAPALAQATDPAPGWAIIVGADYKGETGLLYETVQNDAVRAYQIAVTRWHVPPSHILLLAEGKIIDSFTSKATLPGTMAALQPGFGSGMKSTTKQAPATASELIAQAIARQTNTAAKRKLGNCDATFISNGRSIPMVAAPSHDNFISARDAVSLLATRDQFVAIVISTHAADTSKVAALKLDSGSVDDNALAQEDFALAGCAARNRLLLIDAQDRDMNTEKVKAHTDGSAYASIQKQLSSADGGKSIVITASDGMTPTGVNPNNESYFLAEFAAKSSANDALNTLTIGAIFDKVNRNCRMWQSDVTPRPQALLLPEDAKNVEAASLFTASKTAAPTTAAVALNPIPAIDIALEPIRTSGDHLWKANLVIAKNTPPFLEITASDESTLKKRGSIVAAGLTALVTHQGLTSADLKQIQVKAAEGGEYVVSLPAGVHRPDGKNYLITADLQMAATLDCSPKDLAAQIARKVHLLMDKTYAATAAEEPPSSTDLFMMGTESMGKEHYADAEISFKKAISFDPGYVEAYMHLGVCYIADHKQQDAAAILKKLQGFVDQQLVTLSADQANRLKEMLKQAH